MNHSWITVATVAVAVTAGCRERPNASDATGKPSIVAELESPDLTVARLYQKGAFVMAVVKNAGPTPAKGFDVVISVDGRPTATRFRVDLGPGEEAELIGALMQVGNHVYKAVADPDNKVPESDETNDSMEATFSHARTAH